MTPVTHRGRRRLERERPVERLRGLLDDDLRATGHDLPHDDRPEDWVEDSAPAPETESAESAPAESGGAAARRRRLLAAPPASGSSSSAEPLGPRALPLDPDEQPWVSPIRARLPWATLAIAGLVLILVVVSVLLRGRDQEAVVSAPSSAGPVVDEQAGASQAAAEGGSVEGAGALGAAGDGASAGTADAPASGSPVTVHVVGEVGEPGVVELPAGSRVADAVEAAGGLSESAVTDAVNMAAPAADGVQIVIPDQALAEQWEQDPPTPSSGSGGQTATGSAQAGSAAAGGSPEEGPAATGAAIDLNTATAAQLEELPKVGPVLAQRIVEHREQIGGFRSVEELDDVSGIGPAMMEAIAPLVTV
ncbi:ComEA family DNA-binding protein [Kocuria sp. p3-SID1433]|uniref:ComEA family DNA-binding protein n=1 Tax=unclassified Kocuria TaxID=2649579 RepID=UPI0021A8A812|nr:MULTISPECIES: ComEA family DNA-binding protein [unclassified Kocuria]MCT1600732.1 ComEA family DNA-binding protein [Kocuria sp. p3-SID1428]MCT2178967.1 ComEA family DNA-binding protein [Kocuria sp. p3-SID1433]